MEDQPTDAGDRWPGIWCDAIVLILIAVAFWFVYRTTHDLSWPYDLDGYRDVAIAQTIRDGSFLADPHYAHETIWYNPLVPALTAVGSWITGLPVRLAYVRLGPFLNLLGPLAFYLLTAVWFGRWTALASTVAFLFLADPSGDSWGWASYSPWLFTANFTQALFYLALAAYYRARTTGSLRWYAVFGLLLGLTFLGHTAPALILGIVLLTGAVRDVAWPETSASKRPDSKTATAPLRAAILRFAVPVIIAFVVSLPYSISILFHYHLHIINAAPTRWVYSQLALDNLRTFLTQNLSLFNAVALVGLIALFRAAVSKSVRSIILVWFAVAFAFLVYSYLVQAADRNGTVLPSIVPGFHFLFYLRAVEAVLFGLGLRLVTHAVCRIAGRAHATLGRLPELAVYLVLLATLLTVAFPGYVRRDDFVKFRDQSSKETDRSEPLAWLREHTRADDVILTSPYLALNLVGPAGRKVVVLDEFFSNPYVDWRKRNADWTKMASQVSRGDTAAFLESIKPYGVTYVCLMRDTAVGVQEKSGSILEVQFVGPEVVIFRIVPPT